MTNPGSILVEACYERYVEDLAQASLEQIGAFLRISWDANASDRIDLFEQRFNVDFPERTNGTPIEDPR